MPITIETNGPIMEGSTKVLSVEPKGTGGVAMEPTVLTATFTPPEGDEREPIVKDINDFTLEDGVYSIDFTFDVAGTWSVKIVAEDSQSRFETDSDRIYVHEHAD